MLAGSEPRRLKKKRKETLADQRGSLKNKDRERRMHTVIWERTDLRKTARFQVQKGDSQLLEKSKRKGPQILIKRTSSRFFKCPGLMGNNEN